MLHPFAGRESERNVPEGRRGEAEVVVAFRSVCPPLVRHGPGKRPRSRDSKKEQIEIKKKKKIKIKIKKSR